VGIKLTTSQLKSVQEYCKLNNIEDIDKFISKCYTDGFNIKKYGLLGDNSEKIGGVEEKPVEIEIIKEIRVEVPVEVIKEVEVTKEVIREVPVEVVKEVIKEVLVDKIVEVVKEIPVEKVVIKEVIKEVPVETVVTKIEYISDNTQINELLSKIQQLENRPPEMIETIKEVPVEKIVDRIVEVERVVEVEKIVEKIVEVEKSNDKSLLLQETLQKLRKELSLKNTRIEDLEKINKQLESIRIEQGAVYLKGSNISETM
jgi:hypothetical protein